VHKVVDVASRCQTGPLASANSPRIIATRWRRGGAPTPDATVQEANPVSRRRDFRGTDGRPAPIHRFGARFLSGRSDDTAVVEPRDASCRRGDAQLRARRIANAISGRRARAQPPTIVRSSPLPASNLSIPADGSDARPPGASGPTRASCSPNPGLRRRVCKTLNCLGKDGPDAPRRRDPADRPRDLMPGGGTSPMAVRLGARRLGSFSATSRLMLRAATPSRRSGTD
jgi:hypothetical protein